MVDLLQTGAPTTGTDTTRSRGRPITPERLAEVWPQVSRRLGRMLALRGLNRSECDDLVQEVALRALAVDLPFNCADDLYAWAAPVARHLHIDLIRATGRTTDGDGLAGLAATTNVEHEVERRIVLETALRALATFGEADRAAILDPSCGGRTAREAGTVAVRRHRARQRLRLMLKGALGWTAVVRLGRRADRTTTVPVAATGLVLGPALLLAVLPGVILPSTVGDVHRSTTPSLVRPIDTRDLRPQAMTTVSRADAVARAGVAATNSVVAGPQEETVAKVAPNDDISVEVKHRPKSGDKIGPCSTRDLPGPTKGMPCLVGQHVDEPDPNPDGPATRVPDGTGAAPSAMTVR